MQPDLLEAAGAEKSAAAFKTISEAADLLGVPQHVLRFWESRFPQIKPTKMRGGRRYYRPEDIRILTTIKHLLYKEGYTIEGAKKAFGQSKELPAPAAIPVAKDNSLAAIRQELLDLRDLLREYVS